MQLKDKEWKKLINKNITAVWEKFINKVAADKSSLRYLNLEKMSLKKPHVIWTAAITDDRSLKRAIINARFLTGRNNLHGRRVHYESLEYQQHCKLCLNKLETR